MMAIHQPVICTVSGVVSNKDTATFRISCLTKGSYTDVWRVRLTARPHGTILLSTSLVKAQGGYYGFGSSYVHCNRSYTCESVPKAGKNP
jgi:hypothetical protein